MGISSQKRFEILDRDGFRCTYCGIAAPDTELEVDHIDPVSRGGSDDSKNLTTACVTCNQGKADQVLRRASSLVGLYFRGALRGQVLSRPERDFYLCEVLDESGMGRGLRLLRVDDLRGSAFFEGFDAWERARPVSPQVRTL